MHKQGTKLQIVCMVQCAKHTNKSLKYRNMNLPLILEAKMRKNPCDL